MLERVRIKSYRTFRDLEVTPLSRVNVVAGGNNAGKTSLLEALFLLSGGGHPAITITPYITRNMRDELEGRLNANAILETLWKPLFFGFDASRTIEITAEHEPAGPLSLKIALETKESFDLPLADAARSDVARRAEQLVLRFKQGDQDEITASAHIGANRIEFGRHQEESPFVADFQYARERTDRDDAIRLGSLRKRKQGDVLLDALRVIEPRLRSIEDNSSSGSPMIWGDIGLSELVPLAVMGEGMTRFASVILGIVGVPSGVALIDEVENGIHHSVLTDMWRVIDDSSRRYGVQVFATTHSFECVQAADQAIQTDDLALHRLEVDEGRCRCVTYERSEIAAAIRHDIEVR